MFFDEKKAGKDPVGSAYRLFPITVILNTSFQNCYLIEFYCSAYNQEFRFSSLHLWKTIEKM